MTSTLTFAATANAITYVGATPVFVDVSRDTWNMDPDLLDEELAAQCAARPSGGCGDRRRSLRPVRRLRAHRRDLRALRRAADRGCGRGARRVVRHRGRRARSATCAAFSFNGNKIITTSGGGMLVSHRRDIVERARHLATQAREPAPHYEHRRSATTTG